MTMAEVVLTENEQKQIRINKLKKLQDEGNDPFEITVATQTHHSDEIKADFENLENKEVTILGTVWKIVFCKEEESELLKDKCRDGCTDDFFKLQRPQSLSVQLAFGNDYLAMHELPSVSKGILLYPFG